MISSISPKSCPKTLSMASAMNRSEFHVCMQTLTSGTIIHHYSPPITSGLTICHHVAPFRFCDVAMRHFLGSAVYVDCGAHFKVHNAVHVFQSVKNKPRYLVPL